MLEYGIEYVWHHDTAAGHRLVLAARGFVDPIPDLRLRQPVWSERCAAFHTVQMLFEPRAAMIGQIPDIWQADL